MFLEVLLASQLVCGQGCSCVCGPPAPAGIDAVCPSIVTLTKPYLWKPSSDDTGGSRQGKPAFLDSTHKVSKKTLNTYAVNGQKIGSVGYYGTFMNGSRFYSGWTGGSSIKASDYADRASSQAGSPLIYIELTQGGCVGPFDPRNRTGGY